MVNEKHSIRGPRSEKIFTEEQHYIAPGLQGFALQSRMVVDRAEGAIVYDMDGASYIDFVVGVSVGSLGHCHPKYVAALRGQLKKATFGSFTSPNRAKFLKLLAGVTPGDLNRTQLYSSGAEAVEAALRLARAYTKRYEVIAFWGGFHGKTMGVLGLMGDKFKHNHGPMPTGMHLAPYATCYRCPFNTTYPACDLLCVEFVRKVIRHNTAGSIAAFLIEPIQGTNGNLAPPPGYLGEIANLAKECGALLVADEMITGFGRTGTMFGVNHDGVIPDIMTLGKGMGSGFPVTAVTSTDEITSAQPWSQPSASSSSYGGNPLASTAAYATLKTILDDDLVAHSKKLGQSMLRKLKKMEERYSFVGEVRGKGLMIGVDLVRDKETRTPISKDAGNWLYMEGLAHGIILMITSSVIRINPPLTISKDVADKGLKILDRLFKKMEEEKVYLR